MIIAINNVCNLQCVMCDLHNPKLQKNHKNDFFKKRKYLETEKVYEALYYAGHNGVHMVNLSAYG